MMRMSKPTVAQFNDGTRGPEDTASRSGTQLLGVPGMFGGKGDWIGVNAAGTSLVVCDKLPGKKRQFGWGPEGYIEAIGALPVIVVRSPDPRSGEIFKVEVAREIALRNPTLDEFQRFMRSLRA